MQYWNAFGILLLAVGLIITSQSINNLAQATQNNSKALILHIETGCQKAAYEFEEIDFTDQADPETGE